ncbi:MAG TPA: response regulator [Gemmatimonadales bacterium]|jgi:two-component system response regulator|nr:response regulator [Gemmatimonadales bacterium]
MTESEQVEILLVEDSAEDAELTLRALKKHNLANRIHHAKDGVEALDFLFSRGAHADQSTLRMLRVVLLDLKLPRVDGIEVLSQMRADPRTKLVPVVVLTSSREDPDISRCYALGVNSYIVKPVEFEEFMKAVSSLGMYWLLLNQSPR